MLLFKFPFSVQLCYYYLFFIICKLYTFVSDDMANKYTYILLIERERVSASIFVYYTESIKCILRNQSLTFRLPFVPYMLADFSVSHSSCDINCAIPLFLYLRVIHADLSTPTKIQICAYEILFGNI